MSIFDVIVVGGGSAGCVLASRLSENERRSVLLLEAGEAYRPDAYPKATTDINGLTAEPEFTWGYQSVPGMPPHSVAALAGKLLGGGSAINGAISRRARPSDFARWEAHGLPDWSWEKVLPVYMALENTPTGSDRWHGRTGVWPIRQPELEKVNPVSQAFVQSAMHAGYSWVGDFNGPKQNGVGLEPRNMEKEHRFNTGTTYLNAQVRARKNLIIRGGVQVDRILFSGFVVKGVLLVDGTAILAKRVVLTAGVYGTAAILLRSGIGPKQYIGALGLDMIADLPVGSRFQEQPMFAMAYKLKLDAKIDPPSGSVALWTKSKHESGDELDLQLTAFYQPNVDHTGQPILTLNVWASVVLPRSTGLVRLKTVNPMVTPWIDYHLLGDPADRERQREIIQVARNVARQEPLASLIEQELVPGLSVQTDAELNAAIDAAGGIYYHATSTAPMGKNPMTSVVDTNGCVHGLKGLLVADASVFPEMVSAPVNLTVLMVAERISAGMRT